MMKPNNYFLKFAFCAVVLMLCGCQSMYRNDSSSAPAPLGPFADDLYVTEGRTRFDKLAAAAPKRQAVAAIEKTDIEKPKAIENAEEAAQSLPLETVKPDEVDNDLARLEEETEALPIEPEPQEIAPIEIMRESFAAAEEIKEEIDEINNDLDFEQYEEIVPDFSIPRVENVRVNSRYYHAEIAHSTELLNLSLAVYAADETGKQSLLYQEDLMGALIAGRGALQYAWPPDLIKAMTLPDADYQVRLTGKMRNDIHFMALPVDFNRAAVVKATFHATGDFYTLQAVVRGVTDKDVLWLSYEKPGASMPGFLVSKKAPLFCDLVDAESLMSICKAKLKNISVQTPYNFTVFHSDSSGNEISVKRWHETLAALSDSSLLLKKFFIVPWKFHIEIDGIDDLKQAVLRLYRNPSDKDRHEIARIDITEKLITQKGVLQHPLDREAFEDGLYAADLLLTDAGENVTGSAEALFSIKSEADDKSLTSIEVPDKPVSATVEQFEEVKEPIQDEKAALGLPPVEIESFYVLGSGLHAGIRGLSSLKSATLRTKWSFSQEQDYDVQDMTDVLKIQNGEFKLKDYLHQIGKPGHYQTQLVLRDKAGRTVRSDMVSFRIAGIIEVGEEFQRGHVFFVAQVAGYTPGDRVIAQYRLKGSGRGLTSFLRSDKEVVLECGEPNSDGLSVCYSTKRSELDALREYEYLVKVRDERGKLLDQTQVRDFQSHNERINKIRQKAEKVEISVTSFKYTGDSMRGFVKGHLHVEKAQLEIKRLLPKLPNYFRAIDVSEMIQSGRGAFNFPIKDLNTGFYSCQLKVIGIDGIRAESAEVSFQWVT